MAAQDNPAQFTLWPEIHIVPVRSRDTRKPAELEPQTDQPVQLELSFELPAPVPPFKSIQQILIDWMSDVGELYAANDANYGDRGASNGDK